MFRTVFLAVAIPVALASFGFVVYLFCQIPKRREQDLMTEYYLRYVFPPKNSPKN